jgi:hypothetical protein
MQPLISKEKESESAFQKVRRIMRELETDYLPPAPWTEKEWQEYVNQEPLPPNQPFQLNAEEPKE